MVTWKDFSGTVFQTPKLFWFLLVVMHWIDVALFIWESYFCKQKHPLDGVDFTISPDINSKRIFLAKSSKARLAIRGKASMMTKDRMNEFMGKEKLVVEHMVG